MYARIPLFSNLLFSLSPFNFTLHVSAKKSRAVPNFSFNGVHGGHNCHELGTMICFAFACTASQLEKSWFGSHFIIHADMMLMLVKALTHAPQQESSRCLFALPTSDRIIAPCQAVPSWAVLYFPSL
ncbi:hypothetical protein F4813DRAFT_75885 [Daldinia decipiens]|uniref:uncharacterized protein n=1 Tax=Daldinia decipiens TaxID=326647 RepID=UPI0020C4C377|nr:uncharacterized protein F4813DRAFT_75885 [Daldinia decipiens]KAI1657417.1 hypothetical protein F4813DRAFT_75885 [Daldinia decipiens]